MLAQRLKEKAEPLAAELKKALEDEELFDADDARLEKIDELIGHAAELGGGKSQAKIRKGLQMIREMQEATEAAEATKLALQEATESAEATNLALQEATEAAEATKLAQ